MFKRYRFTSLLATLLLLGASTSAWAQDADGEVEPEEEVVEVVDADGDEEIDAQEALAAGQPLAAASNKSWNIGASLSMTVGQGTFVRLENEGENDAALGLDSSSAYDRINTNLGLSASYIFLDQFIGTLSMSGTQWLTPGGFGANEPYERRISDLTLDIFWFGKTFEKTRSNISADVGVSFPTSRISRAANTIVNPFALLILRQPLLGRRMFFVGQLIGSKTFNTTTSPSVDLNEVDADVLFRPNGTENLGDGLVAIGGRNTEYAFLPTFGFNFIVLPKMTASIRYRYARFWSYKGLIPEDCEQDPLCNQNASGGRGVGDQVSGSVGLNYQVSRFFFLNGSLSSAQTPKTADNTSFRFPFWNFEGAAANASSVNLGLTFNY